MGNIDVYYINAGKANRARIYFAARLDKNKTA